MAKTRVAPLRALSIPRLELQGALMGSRLVGSIIDGHEFPIDATYLCTDSSTVINWLRSDSRQYKQFVAVRIGEILENTDLKDWRWLPTKENVADEATRDVGPLDVSENSRWQNAPKFLYLHEDEWPRSKVETTEPKDEFEEDVKKKKEFLGFTTEDSRIEALFDVQKYSSWSKLIRITAWILRFARNCRKKNGNPTGIKIKVEELATSEYADAENLLVRISQWENFPEEMSCLSKQRELPKDSRLISLTPKIDEKGLMRLGGRIENAQILTMETRRPIILDTKHPLTTLLVMHYHEKNGHQGQERVMNEICQKYWILRARVAIRSAWNKCYVCKNSRANPEIPIMGQLPKERLTRGERAFSHSGVDYFGPMWVKIGRRREKRYGVLFTCLATRAVHIELAASLSTDSAIMALRRFFARRGHAIKLFSDNGTNFRGAAAELSRALEELDQSKIEAAIAEKGVQWIFNPPAAPHMGGVWERLVRSIKTALGATLKERVPTEETLLTLLLEAENLVNSRPLTHVSLDHHDEEALTPNHFLLGTSSGVSIPGAFTDKDLSLRKAWRVAQRLSDHFWRRWVKEYFTHFI